MLYIQFQEKTDEVTNKFLDKKRYVYQPKQPLATVNVDEGYTKSPKKRRHEEADVNLTEDEMSVNTINKYVKTPFGSNFLQFEKKELKLKCGLWEGFLTLFGIICHCCKYKVTISHFSF